MGRRLRGILLGLLLVVGGAAAGGVAWVTAFYPDVRPASRRTIEASPARLARGRYLAETVATCTACHSRRDFAWLGLPVVGRPGGGWGDRRRGGLPMDIEGLPGAIYPRNITPDRETGLGRWSDGEVVRAIREGVSRDGTALFPLMPYEDYRRMSDEDVASIVSYLRTLAPVRQRVPRSDVDLPMSLVMRLLPRPVGRVAEPDRADPVAYGGYLAAIGGCIECHTPWIQGRRHEDELMAGGNRFRTHGWTVRAPNLTPDPATGLGGDVEQFVARFRAYRDLADGRVPPIPARRANTVMPWLAFSRLEDADLRAIWAWLRSLPAIENRVDPGQRPPRP